MTKLTKAERAETLRKLRRVIASTKSHRGDTPKTLDKFMEGLARIGAIVILHEPALFGTLTLPKKRARHARGRKHK